MFAVDLNLPSMWTVLERISGDKRSWISRLWMLPVLVFSYNTGELDGKEYTIGLLIPRDKTDYPYERTASAVSIAQDDIIRDQVLPGHQIRVIWRDTKVDPVEAVGQALALRNGGVDVLIGPPRSICTLPVGYMTSFWNMPHISWVSTDPTLGEKNVFTTLIRVLGPFNKISGFFKSLFKYYNWYRVGMMTSTTGNCPFAAEGIREGFKSGNISIKEDILVDRSLSKEIMRVYLTQLKNNVRIIVVCLGRSTFSDLLVMAHEMGMTGGDYVYITATALPQEGGSAPWDGHPDAAFLKEAYKSVYDVTLGTDLHNSVDDFKKTVIQRMAEPPWNYSQALNLQASEYSPYLYDAVYLYAKLLNESLTRGFNESDGKQLFELTANMSFMSVTGVVDFDSSGDREPIYWLWDYHDSQTIPYVIATGQIGQLDEKGLQFRRQPMWNTADGGPPPDTPPCGWEKCPEDNTARNTAIIAGIISCVLILTLILVIVQLIRKRQFEKELTMMLWRVNYKEIEDASTRKGIGSQFSIASRVSGGEVGKSKSILNPSTHQLFINVGLYKGNSVAIKPINKDNVNLSRADHIELKQIRELNHENLNPFIGACVDAPNICLLYAYCPKGSLQDILENDDIKLDWVFKYSLINDIVNGMCYLHSSSVKSHGRLKSTNCVVDSRWLLKITDYGLNNLLQGQKYSEESGEYEHYRGLLWTSPEILRMATTPLSGTQTGDVYSFGIILHEICYRLGVFACDKTTPKDIITRVCNGTNPSYRPQFDQHASSKVDGYLISLMEQSWLELPDRRPDMVSIKLTIKNHNKGHKGNIMDNMLRMMERYANNLEELVNQRTQELVQEKKKTDMLLYRLLPPLVADKLKTGETVDPELFDNVTIYFSDIVGFTSISAQSSPMQVVELLNQLYTLFDDIIAVHDVYKVETIGDAYMVVSGVPIRNGHLHAGAVADMALNILSALMDFTVPHMPSQKLRIRIGAHTGACCAGVVGLTMPRYCLFGDTVNTASRMESNGKGLRIHISETTEEALAKLGGYIISPRGEINIKGKGMMKTFWLDSKVGYDKSLPYPSEQGTDDDKNINVTEPSGAATA